MDEVTERDYQAGLKEALNTAFDRLNDNQKETAIACLKNGLSQTEYAQIKGVTHQAVHTTLNRVLYKLRNNRTLTVYAA